MDVESACELDDRSWARDLAAMFDAVDERGSQVSFAGQAFLRQPALTAHNP